MESSLSSRAFLCSLSLGAWWGRREDKGEARRIAREHGAAFEDVNVGISLVPRVLVRSVDNAETAIRANWKHYTLTWERGLRVLPRTVLERLTDTHRELRQKWTELVDQFCDVYPALRDEAVNKWGSVLCRRMPNPGVGIRRRFYCKLDLWPFPDTGDFRVEMADARKAEIIAEAQEAIENRMREAVADPIRRAAVLVGKMVERLGLYDAEGTARPFKDSLVENLEEYLPLLRDLNLTNDPEIDWLSVNLPRLIVDPELLRSDEAIRRKTMKLAAEAAQRIEKLDLEGEGEADESNE